ncbi:hypothetical protein Bca4012_057748 [Brassica carinata]
MAILLLHRFVALAQFCTPASISSKYSIHHTCFGGRIQYGRDVPGGDQSRYTARASGGASGIGYAIVGELAGFGAKIHVCDISEVMLNQSLSEWEKKGFPVSGSVCEVTYRPERETLIKCLLSVRWQAQHSCK